MTAARRISTTAVLVVLLLSARTASAQLCLGAPSFRDNPYQVGLTASFTDNARGVEGTFAGGGESLFAGAGVGVLRYDGDVNSTTVSAFVGTELATDRRSTILLCPLGQVRVGVGPDVGGADVSTVTLEGGASLGVIASDNNGLMIVPAFGLAAVYSRANLDFGGTEISNSEGGGIARAGVGLIFNRNVAITPQLVIPFGFGPSDAIFEVRLLFNFGR